MPCQSFAIFGLGLFRLTGGKNTGQRIIKRKAIEDAFSLHQKKGTVSAVRKIVETLGYKFEIREWFNEKRERTAGTFRLFVEIKRQRVFK